MIDSHCHLADAAFAAICPRSSNARGRRACSGRCASWPPATPTESAAAVRVRELWPAIRIAVGVHPHQAGTFAGRAEEAARARPQALVEAEGAMRGRRDRPRLSLRLLAAATSQQAVFTAQVAVARDAGSADRDPHARGDARHVRHPAQRRQGRSVRGVFHCFTGDVAMARTALDLGFHISIAGIVTFPRSAEIREVAAFVPADRLLIETDSPYLAPGAEPRQTQRAGVRRPGARDGRRPAPAASTDRCASSWCGTSTRCWAQLFRRSRLSALTPRSQNQYRGRNCISTASL